MEELPSFVAGKVVRSGGIVRRRSRRDRADFVRRLLEYLEQREWAGAPRHLGFVGDYEQLTFVPGVSGSSLRLNARRDDAIVAVARLLRELHDLTAASQLAAGDEVVCHGDIGLQNTIYSTETGLPVAFIDWESAKPGRRAVDVAMLLWHFTAIDTCGDVGRAVRQSSIALNAYGPVDTDEVLDYLYFRQQATLTLVMERIAAGRAPGPAWARAGLDEQFRANVTWTARNLESLRRGLHERA